jgi:hypothetical protein
VSGIPFKKGRKVRRDFVGSGVDTRRLARRMIAEFAGQARGVGRRARPRLTRGPMAPPAYSTYQHPADVAWGPPPDHFHYVPEPHWTLRVGAFGGWLFLLVAIGGIVELNWR